MSQSAAAFLADLSSSRLLAIIRAADAPSALAAGLALVETGVRHLEVSLTTPGAGEAIRALVDAAEERATVGAGTVLTEADARDARAAGARFVVTPALGAGVATAVELGIPVLAGAMTPSECVAAMAAGAAGVKLFPAGAAGGPAFLAALRDPLPTIPFVPVGGVGAAEAPEYLRRGAIAVGVGGPLLGDAKGPGGDLDALRARAREYLASVASVPR
ncbi:bifunctional 4-hydroxy-2-oxoglutarate aldolase/2-dehydro-3-deoxy-phosphogluconate aldolase [Microbacterium sp. STN6]|uniref:bifunctional 4-hydroxy-2-oxoglutarate aldolase/2-dehydro-3-deoxy-phosphogluconate aldolase n=1 Tax=Microbacterium sp. STN6 TaxID=2995588 RepID=UPI0022608B5E|nr:bifunctional 4-hydroxy-2-oxoglutarate aldolase/2-dehydro-3-deoxy-phosphogluconate aldolase [Microbacterium sp. STN6]MCX7521824.1 bifunctional 4-hydroxy-2-oxoglutarate aldolase/2-dehydro-3-deoxy-phosphogluconate aldolase [Microbacterium sp. STN6]